MRELTFKTLTEILVWAKTAGEFVVEQAPLVAQEILTWGIVKNAFGLAGGLTLLAGAALTARYAILHWCQWSQDDKVGKDMYGNRSPDARKIIPLIGAGIAAVGGTLISALCAYAILYVITAPRLYLIEKITYLLRRVT